MIRSKKARVLVAQFVIPATFVFHRNYCRLAFFFSTTVWLTSMIFFISLFLSHFIPALLRLSNTTRTNVLPMHASLLKFRPQFLPIFSKEQMKHCGLLRERSLPRCAFATRRPVWKIWCWPRQHEHVARKWTCIPCATISAVLCLSLYNGLLLSL